MEITFEAIVSLVTLLVGGGGIFGFIFWRQLKRQKEAEARASEAEAKLKEAEAKQKEAEAKGSEVDMAQKVQDTYQQILADKQKEVEDNHRLIEELRQDRDHYKKDRNELRDQLEKLQKEFRDFRNETDEQRAQMKRDIDRNSRQLECLSHFQCGREDCAIRVPVTISQVGELEKTIRSTQQKPQNDSQDIKYIDPVESDAL